MTTYEITFATGNRNIEDPFGYWYNYYTATSEAEALRMFSADMESIRHRIDWLKVIHIEDSDNIRDRLRHLAWEKYEYGDEYPDEIEEIRKRWNKLVPTARALGITNSEMKDIWNGIGLDASWR